MKLPPIRGTIVKTSLAISILAVPLAALLGACTTKEPIPEVRSVRTVELNYGKTQETNRYTGSVHSRHEVEQGFRVGGKVVERKVDVGQTVRAGDVLAVLEDADYRLAVEAAQQALVAATTQARQAESDRKRLNALKSDGSVSVSDDEHAHANAEKTKASEEAQARNLELARNRLGYTVLRASQSGVVTSVRFEVGQVVAEGQPIVAIANEGEPEIVVDIPEDHLAMFKRARYTALLTSAPDQAFDVVLRELSAQAVPQTRTYRARLKPATPRHMPLGATATLITTRTAGEEAPVAAIPASAITQSNGQPAVWVVRGAGGQSAATVELVRVALHGYRNDEVLVSGPPAGTVVVTAGVQKMAPGLRVALSGAAPSDASKGAAK
jgi:RND family efflux transporter MFP subunit